MSSNCVNKFIIRARVDCILFGTCYMAHFGFTIITLSLPSADFTKVIIFLTIMAFLCLKNENIKEGLFLQPEGIHLYPYIPTYIPIYLYTYIPIYLYTYIPVEEGIRNVVTIGIIYLHNRNNR